MHWAKTADGYEAVFVERVLDLKVPRSIRVSWQDRITGERKSRLIREVRRVVMDDGDLYSFYHSDGTRIEQICCVWGDEVEALVPGFGGGTRILRFEQPGI